MVTQQEHENALTSGLEMLRTESRALSAHYDRELNRVFVELNTGYALAFAPQRSEELHEASADDLADLAISYPGFEIFFPRLDVGLWVPALAKGHFGSVRWEAEWLAAHPLEENPAVRAGHKSEAA